MEKSEQKNIGLRLKKLREDANLSQRDLAEKLKNRGIIKTSLDGETGSHTISQIERAVRGLTIDMALEYTHIFNVSLDYIYGKTQSLKPDYNEIRKEIGLSDNAINKLEEINHNNNSALLVLDYLLDKKSEQFTQFLTTIKNYATFDKDNNPHKVIIEELDYAKNENLDDELLLLLFKISEISKSLAYDLRKSENKKFIEEKFSSKNIENHKIKEDV